MSKNPLRVLEALGQSIWLDDMRRGLLDSGELKRLIGEDGVSGVTINPTILEKAITGSHDYDEAIQALALNGKTEAEIYEALAIEDTQRAADELRPIYGETHGRQGLVSLEVAPGLAYDTAGTVAEARRFWSELDRPNVMIKVPATREGLAAIQQLTAEGLNVNVTLLFGLPRYRQVAEAYLQGLEARQAQGKPLDHITSVASFFLSRIDVLVDKNLDTVSQEHPEQSELAAGLHGRVAIASAKLAYEDYTNIFEGSRFQALGRNGARPQNLLWASTGTKDPKDSDVKYIEALIGPDTINTVPLKTLEAYRDHGHPAVRLDTGFDEAHRVFERLAEVGLAIDDLTQQLEDEGVRKFADSYDHLCAVLHDRRAKAEELHQPTR